MVVGMEPPADKSERMRGNVPTGEGKKDFLATSTLEGSNKAGKETTGGWSPIISEALEEIDDAEMDSYILYSNNGSITTQHKVEFMGDRWKLILEQNRSELCERFHTSTAKALSLPKDDIFGIFFSTGSLLAQFSVRHSPSMSIKAINEALITHAYEEVWALYYKEEKEPGIPQLLRRDDPLSCSGSTTKIDHDDTIRKLRKDNSMEESCRSSSMSKKTHSDATLKSRSSSNHPFSHRKSFPGNSWATILQEQKSKIIKAIDLDVSDATGISDEIQKKIYTEGEKLIIICTAKPNKSMDQSTLSRQLSQHKYPHLWSLYKANDDYNPKQVLNDDESDMERSMKSNKSSFSRGNKNSFRKFNDTQVSPNKKKRTPAVIIAAQRKSLLSGSLPEEKFVPLDTALPTPESDFVVTQHRIEFDGDGWDVVLEWKREELCKAFDADVCETLKIPRGSVMDAHFALGSLSVDFGIRHDPSLRKRDLDKLLTECNFDRVWNLYDNRDDHGKKDDVILASKLSTATEDPPVERGGVLPTSVEPLVIEVHGKKLVVTQHRIEFDGDGWDVVLEWKREELCKAFDADVCETLKIPRGSVMDAHFALGSLSVDFGIRHDPSLRKRDLDKLLTECNFDRVWNLYDNRDDHGKKDDVILASKLSTATEDPPVERGGVHRNPTSGNLRASAQFSPERSYCTSTGAIVLKPQKIFLGCYKDEDSNAPLESVMEVPNDDDLVVTRHRVRFDGDDWDLVLERKRDALNEAFDADVCDALGIPRGSVVNPKFVLGSLSVEFGVRHLASLSKRDVAKGLRRCEFPSVWKLYEPRGTKPTDEALHATEALAATAAPLESVMEVPNDDDLVVTRHRVRFDGDDWDLVLERKRDALNEAFDADVCDALGIPRGSVVNPKFVLGSLSVEFGVRHLASLSKRDVAKGLRRCEFPFVWKLYEPRQRLVAEEYTMGSMRSESIAGMLEVFRPGSRVLGEYAEKEPSPLQATMHMPDMDEIVVTRHRVQFDGDDWDLVLERKRDALNEAFDADVCDALGIPRGSVVNPKFVLGSLSVEFGVRHLASLSKRDVTKGLRRCEFLSVWKLYEPRQRLVAREYVMPSVVPVPLSATETILPTLSATEECAAIPVGLQRSERVLPTLSATEECAAIPVRLQGSERVLPTLSATEECAAIPVGLQRSERVLPTLSATEECAAIPVRLQGSERVLPTLRASEECAAIPVGLQGSERVLPTLRASEECCAIPVGLQGSERVLPTVRASEECCAIPVRLQRSERVLPTVRASEECCAIPVGLQGSERVLPTVRASEECAATPIRLQGSERVLPTLSATEECAAIPVGLQRSERVLPTLSATEECAAIPVRLQGSERVLPTVRASEECAAIPVGLQGSERVLPTLRASEECCAIPVGLQGSERVLPTLRASEECCAIPVGLQGSERVLPTVRASEECCAIPVGLQGSERVLPTVRASEECCAIPVRLQRSERVLPTLSATEECAAIPVRLQSSEEILPTLRACEKSYPVEKLFPVDHIPVVPAQPGKKAQPDALRGSNGKGSYERQSVCKDDSTKKKDVSGSIPSKASKVCAAYRVGFVGRGWNVVADRHKTRLKECILRDLLDVGDVIPKSVENVSCSSSGDVVVTVLLEHPVTLSQDDVCRLLDDASFPEMWSLHDEVAALDQPGHVTTFHRVGFMGSEWSSKIQGNVVHAAFVKDVVDVLRVKPEDVRIVAYHVSENLVIDFYVNHRASLTESSIDEQLDRAPFEWVWEVYRNAQRPSMYELKPLGVPAQPATLPPRRRLAPRTNGVTRLRALRPKARTGYSQPGLPHLQPLNKQREWYGESEGEMYSPQGEYTLSRNHMMELPRIVQTPPLPLHRHPRADFGMAQQQRQVNLSEVNDVLGQQKQRLQHPPHAEDGPNMGLVPLNYELEPVHGEGRRKQPRPFRAKLWRP